MLSTIMQPILDSFTDVAQNPISISIIVIISLLLVSLLLAMIFPSCRELLVRGRILEEDEKPSSLFYWILIVIIIVKCIQAFIIQPFIVDGGSMLPTFHNREFLLVDKLSYKFETPKRGDVTVFKLYEGNPNAYTGKHLIKRIIGLPGERVVIQQGITTIYNAEHPEGFILDETYVKEKDTSKNANIILDEDHYFVMGDNRAQSYDSRDWGPLEEINIRGRALLRIYPLSEISYTPGGHTYSQ